MKIFLVVVYYMPSTKSSAILMYDLAQELLSKGHEVSIITISDNIKENFTISIEDKIRVLRIKSGRIDGANKFQRTINEFLLSSNIWKRGKAFFDNHSCDLVVWYSPSIFFTSLIEKIKIKYNSKSYLILRDIFPQWTLETGVLKKGIIFNFFKKHELKQYKAADVIGVQSPANLNYFKLNKLDARFKIEVLYNWANSKDDKFYKSNFRSKFNLWNKVVFFYGGNIGVAQDLDNVINLAYDLRLENKAYFLIVGDGSESDRLKKLIFDLQLDNIKILESVDQNTYFSMLSEFDVGLITLDKKFKLPNFPGKMLGYLNSSKPILASINSGNDLKDVLIGYDAGMVSINGDNIQFLDNALYLINNPDIRIKMGANGKRLLENLFSSNHAVNQILSHF